MDERKWFDNTQPQTLQSAVLLSYLNAALSVFFSLLHLGLGSVLLAVVLGGALGAIGIANDKKWGYWLCVVCAVLYALAWLALLVGGFLGFNTLLNLLFAVVLVVLLLHPMSREYRRIWFR